jgi:hypothetical protein
MSKTAGELLVALAEVDDLLDLKNGELRELKLQRGELVQQIETLMDEQGTTMLAAGGLVCTAKYEDVPQLTDWNKLEEFVYRHKRLDLFQRRLSPAVWRELVEQREGQALPGVAVFTSRKLSVRSAK